MKYLMITPKDFKKRHVILGGIYQRKFTGLFYDTFYNIENLDEVNIENHIQCCINDVNSWCDDLYEFKITNSINDGWLVITTYDELVNFLTKELEYEKMTRDNK